jgi:hypothetical protein
MAKAAKPPAVRGGPNKVQRTEIVQTAQKAWNAIMSGEGDRWPYWEEVCPALRLCREDAMQAVGLDPTNDATPIKNGRYNTAMTRYLRDIGLGRIPRSSRKACIDCSYYLQEIDAWRQDLRVSAEEKERAQYLNLSHPQVVWRDFSKWMGWQGDNEETEKPFLRLVVKKALALPDSTVAAGLAQVLPAKRTYSIAAGMLHRLDPQMRPVVADALDVPPDSKHDAVLALLDRLGWDSSERSRLSDAMSFGQGDRENAEIAALKARIAELEQAAKDTQTGKIDVRLAAAQDEIGSLRQRILELLQGTPPASTTTEWATGDEAARQIADLTDRLRTAEARIMRYEDEQFADGADPLPKSAYREQAQAAIKAQAATEDRIRELQAERDAWRVRTHAGLEQRYRSRTANAERERDDAVKARDATLIELRAADAQIAAMREPLASQSLNEAQKRNRAEVSERIAQLRAKHAIQQEGENETPPPKSQSDQ